MKIEFFLPMIPPTVTQQEHKVMVRGGKPVFYDPQELKAARGKLIACVAPYAPDQPIQGPVRLITKWIWPIEGMKADYSQIVFDSPLDLFRWKETKPDTDNMIKMLKDCMTKVGFWKDDAQVASEVTEKFMAAYPGIYVKVETL